MAMRSIQAPQELRFASLHQPLVLTILQGVIAAIRPEVKTRRGGHAQVDPSVHHVQETIGRRRRAVRDELVVPGKYERHVFPIPESEIVLLLGVLARFCDLERSEQRLSNAEERADPHRLPDEPLAAFSAPPERSSPRFAML